VNVMTETRHELSNYRDIIEISERIKRPEVKKDSKDRMPEASISRKLGSYTKALAGAPFAKRLETIKCWDDNGYQGCRVFQVSQEGTLCEQVSVCKGEGWEGFFKVRQLEEQSAEKMNEKSIRQIRIRHSDLNNGYHDPFLCYCIKINDLSGPACDRVVIWFRCS